MKRLAFPALLVAATMAIGEVNPSAAFERHLVGARGHRASAAACNGANGAASYGAYYHVAWGWPVALVVPPTAEYQTHWGWGVGNTRVTPIWAQFQPTYLAPAAGGQRFLPTPPWPSDTDQFGVYYVRGPW